MARTILIVDDEQNMRWVLERALEKAGYDTLTAENGEQALRLFARQPVDLILLDLKMRGMDGVAVLREVRQRSTSVPVLLLTAYATVPTAVEALQAGATDYLRKPFDLETVLSQVNRYLTRKAEESRSPEPVPQSCNFDAFIGATPVLTSVLNTAAVATETDYPVLLQGEQGTGRKHLARLIHQHSTATANGRLVIVQCATLPPTLLRRELLAHAEDMQAAGTWQQALGGSLLLADAQALDPDFAGELVPHLTGYLRSPQRPHGLRLLLTSDHPLPSIWDDITRSSLTIHLPPLRDRKADLPLLLAAFAPNAVWSRDARNCMAAYAWPGNIAELHRVVQQAAYLAGDDTIQPYHLPGHMSSSTVETPGIFVLPPEGVDLEEVEQELIRQALEMAHHNKTQAAKLLGISRATLLYRLDKYEIEDET